MLFFFPFFPTADKRALFYIHKPVTSLCAVETVLLSAEERPISQHLHIKSGRLTPCNITQVYISELCAEAEAA